MHDYPNLLIISGTGRKVGKTTLACTIIRDFAKTKNIIGLKITPHFHSSGDRPLLIFECESYRIFEEKSMNSGKDSARMLKAGATNVFYIEVRDDSLLNAFQHFVKLVKPAGPVICESPALRNHIRPGVFFLVENPVINKIKHSALKQKEIADQCFVLNKNTGFQIPENLSWNDKQWCYKAL